MLARPPQIASSRDDAYTSSAAAHPIYPPSQWRQDGEIHEKKELKEKAWHVPCFVVCALDHDGIHVTESARAAS